jgi:CheY-like chemotaxis protein
LRFPAFLCCVEARACGSEKPLPGFGANSMYREFGLKGVFRLCLMSPNRLTNCTIIVIEDHDDSRSALGLFLARMGADVVLASNGVEGLEAVKNHHPHLVLTDLNMPEMNGFELLREIRALRPDAVGNVPVIAMTAFETRIERARILNMGFQACLQKPSSVENLVETMLSLLEA